MIAWVRDAIEHDAHAMPEEMKERLRRFLLKRLRASTP